MFTTTADGEVVADGVATEDDAWGETERVGAAVVGAGIVDAAQPPRTTTDAARRITRDQRITRSAYRGMVASPGTAEGPRRERHGPSASRARRTQRSTCAA